MLRRSEKRNTCWVSLVRLPFMVMCSLIIIWLRGCSGHPESRECPGIRVSEYEHLNISLYDLQSKGLQIMVLRFNVVPAALQEVQSRADPQS